MNNDYIEIEDIAEVLAYIISQEKVMSVPPVLIPTDGATRNKECPKKEPRNKFYKRKDPRNAQSVSDNGSFNIDLTPFPIRDSEVELDG